MRGFLPTLNNLKSVWGNQLAKERILFLGLVTLLVIIWFHQGLLIGSGESGLPFYNTQKELQLSISSWTDVPLGTGSAIGYASFPLYAIVTLLESLGVAPYILQAALYWLLLIVGVLAIHKLASLTEGNTALTRLSSSLFYIFNPIVHVGVLHRVQYPLMYFYSYLPLSLVMYFQGLKNKKLITILYINLIGLFFSFAFTGPSFIELTFMILGLLSLYQFISGIKERKMSWYPITYYISFIITFLLVHAWWLVPFFNSISTDLGVSSTLKYFNANDNVETFKSISEHLQSILSVFRLVPAEFYLGNGSSWGWIYSTPPFVILSFFSTFAFITSLFLKRKEFLFRYLIISSLIVMFFMKGSLPPFGSVTLFFFKSFSFLQVLRNPFEKVGLLLPIVMAIPVGIGSSMIINFFARWLHLSRLVMALIVLILIYPAYMFPIINGYVFTGGGPPADRVEVGQYVKVPPYYADAREWLNEQSSSSSKQSELFRVLVLPIDGEGMTYKWEYGFAGVELSNNLFDQSMISFNTSQGSLPEMIGSVKESLAKFPKTLWILAQMMNVKYIMVRDDIDNIARDTEPASEDLKIIKDNLQEHFSQVAEFGKLKFFEINPQDFFPRVFADTGLVYLFDPLGKGVDLMPFSGSLGHEIFVSASTSPNTDPNLKYAKRVVTRGFKIEDVKVDDKNPIEALPYVSLYRDTPFYALVRLKEELESQFQSQDTQLSFKTGLLGKRLTELNHSPKDKSALEEYKKLFLSLSQELLVSEKIDQGLIYDLIRQRIALDTIKDKTDFKDELGQVGADIDRLLINLRVKAIFPSNKSYAIRVYIPKASQYEVLLSKDKWNGYYKDTTIKEFDLDGKAIKLDTSPKISSDDVMSLGVYNLSQGLHEIALFPPEGINLIAETLPEELIISSQAKQPLTKTLPIQDLNNAYTYSLSFEYLEEKGSVPVVALHSDVDFIDKKGERVPRFAIALDRDNYDFGWKRYNGHFNPIPASHQYSVSFKVLPFGDCKTSVQRPFRRYCEDKGFNQRFLSDSLVKIRNLKIEKVFNNPIILRQVSAEVNRSTPPKVEFEKINAARYKVKVSGAKSPFLLVLSTTFDKKWNASFLPKSPKGVLKWISNSQEGERLSDEDHFTVNGYANGWHVDRLGDFEMYLEYDPVNLFIVGQKFSIIIIVLASIWALYNLIYAKYINR